ncbi:TetR/AcrR family transcriptional regulator [Nonomuraea aurantiaca]|uniref:TetR/AcrR family transcriptional regulator n=1 Tax=Nonomuraea aurantiaca TaxID=2878562 RepID=UPI001CD95D63|nr:TetR/AcrR family transcriptional regulator [Nonomuraea aurantiaca]MCA2220711.1 TetR/AcrR family transcriptional regulator [Nonomuraea aurantiaca]
MRKLKTERQPEILDAALAIADERGLDALTMRAVAERIGLTPMALYGYFRNKDELLDGLVGRLLTTLPAGPPSESWDQRLSAFAWATRRLAREHPSVFPLLFARPSVTADAVRVVDWIYQALIDAGVPDAEVPRIERMVSTFVLGFATSEANGRFSAASHDVRSRRGRGDFPAHQRLMPYLDAPADLDAEFAADLADLVRIIRPA